MMQTALDTRTAHRTDAGDRTMSQPHPFDMDAFGLVRRFVEEVLARSPSGTPGRNIVDWATVEAAIAGSESYEHAIGRAVVIADRMCRGVFGDTGTESTPTPFITEPEIPPFFAFSVTDVAPDFGDESRYRTRVARRVARLLATLRTDKSPRVPAVSPEGQWSTPLPQL